MITKWRAKKLRPLAKRIIGARKKYYNYLFAEDKPLGSRDAFDIINSLNLDLDSLADRVFYPVSRMMRKGKRL